MGVQEIADTLKDRVAASGFEKSIRFDTGDDGVMVINQTSVTTVDGPADCTIKLSLANLEGLVDGTLNPTMAFMQGKIKLEGDMAVAMALGKVLKP